MQNLSYVKPQTLAEAVAIMAKAPGRVKPYAGGTDLMVQLREGARRLAGVDTMLDLSGLPELRGITAENGVMRIGTMASHTEVSQSPLVRRHANMLACAASTVGSPQIRNKGTIGGNICNGSPAADTLSPLVALDARLVIHGAKGERTALVKDIYEGANKVNFGGDEIVSAIEFDIPAACNTAFIKLGRRKALAISRMNVAAVLKMEEGKITYARIVPGCVFGTPSRVECAEDFLLGKAPGAALFEECGKKVSEEMIRCTGVRWSTEYKQPVVEALTQRALSAAAGIEGGEQGDVTDG